MKSHEFTTSLENKHNQPQRKIAAKDVHEHGAERRTKRTRREIAASIAAIGVATAAVIGFNGISNESQPKHTETTQATFDMHGENASNSEYVVNSPSQETLDTLEAARAEIRSGIDVRHTNFVVTDGNGFIPGAIESLIGGEEPELPFLTNYQKDEITITSNNLAHELGGVIPDGYEAMVAIADFNDDGALDVLVERGSAYN